jgi:hypothetical protein
MQWCPSVLTHRPIDLPMHTFSLLSLALLLASPLPTSTPRHLSPSAAPRDVDCVCPLSDEPVQYPEDPPEECGDEFTVDIFPSTGLEEDGRCAGGECGMLELLCHTEGEVIITGDFAMSDCRFSIYQDLVRIGGGRPAPGAYLDADLAQIFPVTTSWMSPYISIRP